MRNDDPVPPPDSVPVLRIGIAHPARIDREDGRTARGRLQHQAIKEEAAALAQLRAALQP